MNRTAYQQEYTSATCCFATEATTGKYPGFLQCIFLSCRPAILFIRTSCGITAIVNCSKPLLRLPPAGSCAPGITKCYIILFW